MADKEKEEPETEDERKTREAREEEFQMRRDKFSKMEEDREKVRTGIREKYNIKKKEEENPFGMGIDMSGLRQPKKEEDEGDLMANLSDPMKMGGNLLGKATGLFSSIPFPWK